MELISLTSGLIVLSVALSIIGAWACVRDTLAGKTKPNRVSWFLWALAPIIGAAAAAAAGGEFASYGRTLLAGIMPGLVFIASFYNSQSYWKTTRFDIFCAVTAVAALIAWGFAHSPLTAIVLSTAADGFASIPTVVKAWRHPETETGMIYLTTLLSVGLVFPTISAWTLENYLFPVYLVAINIILVWAVYRPRRQTGI
ncbi:MAG: hypothetical protein RL417_2523 [Pseudomonadota bacterium]